VLAHPWVFPFAVLKGASAQLCGIAVTGKEPLMGQPDGRPRGLPVHRFRRSVPGCWWISMRCPHRCETRGRGS
ncbi:MAG: hypothetical protein M3545_10000, partial [Acidobacteriota bacterium]|nr:hypothetical protein [Acidobacteriota bacterium]